MGIEEYEKELIEISACHAEKILHVADIGNRKGRGAVVVQVDVDSRECEVNWCPIDSVEVEQVRKLVRRYDYRPGGGEFLVVIVPMGRLAGIGAMMRILPLG